MILKTVVRYLQTHDAFISFSYFAHQKYTASSEDITHAKAYTLIILFIVKAHDKYSQTR